MNERIVLKNMAGKEIMERSSQKGTEGQERVLLSSRRRVNEDNSGCWTPPRG